LAPGEEQPGESTDNEADKDKAENLHAAIVPRSVPSPVAREGT
jgi:hypothetical protein